MSAPTPNTDAETGTLLGRWTDLAIRWGLDVEEQSALVGRRTPSDDGADAHETTSVFDTDRMSLLLVLDAALPAALEQMRYPASWLRTPRARFDGCSPLELMASSSEWTRWFIRHLGLLV